MKLDEDFGRFLAFSIAIRRRDEVAVKQFATKMAACTCCLTHVRATVTAIPQSCEHLPLLTLTGSLHKILMQPLRIEIFVIFY